jgi:glycosyltransferase involved in cell wall biosynthesis
MIVSTTITNSRGDVIRAALTEIAPHVDQAIVIDTGATDDTMKIAAEVLGEKFRPRVWPWRNDFAAARNQALVFARDLIRLGGREPDAEDWIITADTDEWLHVPRLREVLATVPIEADVVMVPHHSRTYRQCRCIRATCKGQWSMPVHEYFSPYRSIEAPADWTFECQPRPTEDRTAKYEHYRRVLEKETAENPKNERAFYYLGDTLAILGYKGAAIKAFDQCGSMPGWNEQASWARYRAAILQFELGLTDHAIETCVKGIARTPTMAELYWLAGWLCYQQGNYQAAANFAEAAVKIGPKPRAGFCFPQAQKELPEQLLRFAQAQLAGKPLETTPE